MLLTIGAAAAVVSAELCVRRRVNAAPPERFPHPVGNHLELRRAHNRGLVGSRLEDRPRLVIACQTAANIAAVGAAGAVQLWLPGSVLAQLGTGLVAGGALSNLLERYHSGAVTDYLHGVKMPLDLLNRRIWNIADMAVFNGCVLALVGTVV